MTKSKLVILLLLSLTLGGCDVASSEALNSNLLVTILCDLGLFGAEACQVAQGIFPASPSDDAPAADSDAAPYTIWVAEASSSTAMSEIQVDLTTSNPPTIKGVPNFPNSHAGGITAWLNDPSQPQYGLYLWHDNVIEVMSATGTPVASLKVPVSGTIEDFTIAADGLVGTACVKGDPNLYSFDLQGRKYLGLTFTAAGANLRGFVFRSIIGGYATDAANGSLYFDDGKTVVSIPLSSQPTELGKPTLTPDGTQLWVPGVTQNNVFVVDTGSNKISASLTFPNLFDPREIVFSRNGLTAYILFSPPASFGAGSIAIVDTPSQQLLATVPVGRSPSGLTISPDGTYVFVANSGDGNVAVFSPAKGVTTFKVGTTPVGVVAAH